ncbi:hypothetical protein DO97_17285 [Neosynechococcus sphagnicola sy1]|uniref:Uncharacterized protein n=1 Tax=Neosynechococcus sphagnicola sy1 TaxID=1497020 RepID=A0A098THP1_9CYAN|nr:hypothetical protein DO97_17285 [Neosynechococcus sphagnicola sy1]
MGIEFHFLTNRMGKSQLLRRRPLLRSCGNDLTWSFSLLMLFRSSEGISTDNFNKLLKPA